jgi:hypothetical protein
MTLHLCTGYRDASGKLADAGISSVMMTMTPFVKISGCEVTIRESTDAQKFRFE